MGIASFHEFGRQVNCPAFAEQLAEMPPTRCCAGASGGTTNRTPRSESRRSGGSSSQSFADAEAWFLRARGGTPERAPPGETTVSMRDCAGWWRRFAAWGIDAVIVIAIITSFGGSRFGCNAKEATASVTPGDVEIAAPGLATIRITEKNTGRRGDALGAAFSNGDARKMSWDRSRSPTRGRSPTSAVPAFRSMQTRSARSSRPSSRGWASRFGFRSISRFS